jgi:hypothetical protein
MKSYRISPSELKQFSLEGDVLQPVTAAAAAAAAHTLVLRVV